MFRNPATTEFVIVTIPTAMAAAESIRLAKALKKEQVRRLLDAPVSFRLPCCLNCGSRR